METSEERFDLNYYIDEEQSLNLSFCDKVINCETFARMCKAFATAVGFPKEQIERYFIIQ